MTAQTDPPIATSSMSPPVCRMKGMSPLVMPVFTTSDIRVGRYRSDRHWRKTTAITAMTGIA